MISLSSTIDLEALAFCQKLGIKAYTDVPTSDEEF